MKIVSLMLPGDLKTWIREKKTVIATILKKKKLPTKFFIHFKIRTIKVFGQI